MGALRKRSVRDEPDPCNRNALAFVPDKLQLSASLSGSRPVYVPTDAVLFSATDADDAPDTDGASLTSVTDTDTDWLSDSDPSETRTLTW